VGIITLDITLVGLDGIIKRKMKWGITLHYYETYQGLACLLGAGF
jgi:hypothetical protein